MKRRLFISFSGGETSALMTILILTLWRDQWDEIVVLFANTGCENEETLQFVKQCEQLFGVPVVWVEAAVVPGRAGTEHRVVTFDTASRNGEPFRAVIAKYGIPNNKFPHCTRELKQRPMYSYLRRVLKWKPGTYDVAIGIRADEPHRVSKTAAASRIIYPLVHMKPTTKPDVNLFWSRQEFRLNLMGYEGNCKTCWKKSFRKLLTIMQDTPEKFAFFDEMEQTCGHIGAEFQKKVVPGYKRVFFRGNASVSDLRRLCAEGGFERAENDAAVLPSGEQVPYDVEPGDGCTENCEVNFEERL